MIALNDRAAMGVYQAVAAAGLRIPDDLSVVSFDNSDLARWLDPAPVQPRPAVLRTGP